MGIILQNNGADYSSLDLGFSDLITEFTNKAGITDAGQKAAVRTLYNDAVSANIWNKIYGICLFPGSTALTQKWVLAPVISELSFVNGTHSADGYKANAAGSGTNGAYADWIAPAGEIVNFSCGAYFKTSEGVSTGQPYVAMGVAGNGAAGAAGDHFIALSRAWGSNSLHLGACAQKNGTSWGNSVTTTTGQVASTKTGFLQFVKVGNSMNLIDDAISIRSVTASTFNAPQGGGTSKMVIGNRSGTNGTITNAGSIATLSFAYWGALNVTEAIAWDEKVKTFLVNYGRTL